MGPRNRPTAPHVHQHLRRDRSAGPFVAFEVVGGAIAVVGIRIVYPNGSAERHMAGLVESTLTAIGQVDMPEVVSRQAVHDELEGTRAAFHRLVEGATPTDLRRLTHGTRWTNEQLLFHMLLGYLIVRPLLVLARVFARLPAGASRRFAALLNSATPVFDEVNFYGSCLGARVVGRRRMVAMFDRVIAALHRSLAAETGTDLQRGMVYPVRWDPFFKEFMTLADIYRYPTRHFEFHRRQLTLVGAQHEEP